MQSAGCGEDLLRTAHHWREFEDRACRDGHSRSDRRDPALGRLDTGLAAYAAARRDREVALEALAQVRRRNVEDDVNRIGIECSLGAAQAANLAEVGARFDEAFGE